MDYKNGIRFVGILALTLAAAGCSANAADDETDVDSASQEYKAAENGLITVNGLTTVNGLITVNGLTTVNGLITVNGLVPTSCSSTKKGSVCAPDGLLSSATGMMATATGKATAGYVVRCALAAGTSVTVKDSTGALVTLPGELGLATGWKTGQCDTNCQELISACLMAFTNGSGNHVAIEFSADAPSIGAGHSSAYPYQEAAFYGNLFSSPPKANFCDGSDAEGFFGFFTGEQRACSGWTALGISCPYKKTGSCAPSTSDFAGRCTYTGGTADGTATDCKNWGGTSLDWHNVIMTYRQSVNL